ncbi:MAG: sigma-70 family RNA polymerase sigma factor [Gemmatimonadota bacterium]|nr:MAG: sigma-70 family RNA polymerase sigma factor [Gemmatimonadota bacterium]
MMQQEPDREASRREITGRLLALQEAGPEAWESLVPLVYEELRAIAHRHLLREPQASLLDTTDLVHEAFMKLVDQTRVEWRNRAHFFGVASMVMRRILVNEAHRRRALKRGGRARRIPLDESVLPAVSDERAEKLIALDEALKRLTAVSQRQVHVIECRFFGGLSNDEVAVALSVSPATVKRDWRTARAWLFRELDLAGL